MTCLQLALIHENEELLLKTARLLLNFNFNVFACHDIDAAHAAIDHENIAALILNPNCDSHVGHWNRRVIYHLKSYHPSIPIIFADLTDSFVSLSEKLLQALGPAQILPSSLPGQLFHMKQLPKFIASQAVSTVFQPIVSLSTEKSPLIAFEALSRISWPHSPAYISPEVLFSYAANSGYLFELDMHCMRSAFLQCQKQSTVQQIFINIRPLTLIHPDFYSQVLELKRTLSNQQIVFELTEHEALPNLAILAQAVQKVKDLGFKLAIDDFGEASANLNLLCLLTPSFIKLSGVFAQKLQERPRQQAIIKAATELSRSLGIEVILEKIDSAACAEEARLLGVHYGQGYYFGRPFCLQS